MAILTLRPNAVGIHTLITYQYPDSTYHWDKVDEETADAYSTYVFVTSVDNVAEDKTDDYGLPDHTSEAGTINSVKVYFVCRVSTPDSTRYAYAHLNISASMYDGSAQTVTTSWTTFSETWTTNPKTLAAWTWADIDNLRAGVRLYVLRASGSASNYCTQVYVEVDYTPAGWAHIAKVSGVTATTVAKMNGVAVAGIAKVNGVAV